MKDPHILYLTEGDHPVLVPVGWMGPVRKKLRGKGSIISSDIDAEDAIEVKESVDDIARGLEEKGLLIRVAKDTSGVVQSVAIIPQLSVVEKPAEGSESS